MARLARLKRVRGVSRGGGGSGVAGLALPYSVDFTTLPDGALPALFTAPTWAISGAKAVNTPTFTEMLTNGTFTNWTGDNPDSWTVSYEDANNYSQSPAGQCHMVIGSSSVAFATQTIATLPGGFYKGSMDCTAWVSGTANLAIGNITHNLARVTAAGTFTSGELVVNPITNAVIYLTAYGKPLDAVVDNASLRRNNSPFALVEAGTANVTVKAGVTVKPTNDSWVGVIARADSPTNPQNFLMAVMQKGTTYGFAFYKCVNGVFTKIKDETGLATGTVEIRCNGTAIEAWTGIYQRYTGTVDEPTINGNKYHGLVSLDGGNSVNSFFLLEAALITTVFMGGSNTSGSPSTPYWGNFLNNDSISKTVSSTVYNAGWGGATSWWGMFRFTNDVVPRNPNVLFLEFAVNDAEDFQSGSRTNKWKTSAEAFIRRLRAALPNTLIVFANLVNQVGLGADYYASRDMWIALCEKYDIPYERIDLRLQEVLGTATPTVEQLTPYWQGGPVHFSTLGHQEIANMFAHEIHGWYPPRSAGWTPPITNYDPPYFDDLADWMGALILRNGTDNNGETGVWTTTNTTERQSSEVGATIQWTGTFCSFGLDLGYGNGAIVSWKLDSGAETQIDRTGYGAEVLQIDNFARGVHTVTLKVIAGTVSVHKFIAV